MSIIQYTGDYYYDTIPTNPPSGSVVYGLVYPNKIYEYQNSAWVELPEQSFVFLSTNINATFNYVLESGSITVSNIQGDYVSDLNNPTEIGVNPYVSGDMVLFANSKVYIYDGAVWTDFDDPVIIISTTLYVDKYGVIYNLNSTPYTVASVDATWYPNSLTPTPSLGQTVLSSAYVLYQQPVSGTTIILPSTSSTIINTNVPNRTDIAVNIPIQIINQKVASLNTLAGIIYTNVSSSESLYGGNTLYELLMTLDGIYQWYGDADNNNPTWNIVPIYTNLNFEANINFRFTDVYTNITYQFLQQGSGGNITYHLVGVQEICGIISDVYMYDLTAPTSGLPRQLYLTKDNAVRYYDAGLWRVVQTTPTFVFRDTLNGGIWLISTTNGMTRTRIQSANQLSSAITNKYVVGNFNDLSPPQNLIENNLRTIIMDANSSGSLLVLDPQPPLDAYTNSDLVAIEGNQWVVYLNSINVNNKTATFEYYDNGSKITLQYIFNRYFIDTNTYYYATLDTELTLESGTITEWQTVYTNGGVNINNGVITLPEGQYKAVLEFNYTIDTLVGNTSDIPYVSIEANIPIHSSIGSFPTIDFNTDENTHIYGPLQKSSFRVVLNIYEAGDVSVIFTNNNFTQNIQTSNGQSLTTLTIQKV